MSRLTINGTAVSINGRGVLLLGPSGAGKSDMALRLIDRGAVLISDDRVVVEERTGQLILSPHAEIAGKFEVRNVGITTFPTTDGVLELAVELSGRIERLPESDQIYEIMGCKIRKILLNPFELSAPIKVELALQAAFLG